MQSKRRGFGQLPSPVPFSWFSLLTLVIASLFLFCNDICAQTVNLNYTSDMPNVERVKAEVKGSDPTDTLARQVAAFNYLSQYIQHIKYNRTVRGPYTPDETRLLTAYSAASYQISQDYAKSHTPAETAAFERLHGKYETDPALHADWFRLLIGKQSAAALRATNSELGSRARAHFDEERRITEEALAASSKGSGDPTTLAARRCVELGGDTIACAGKSFFGGLLGMFGLDTNTTFRPTRVGVALSGIYHDRNGVTSINFGPDTAAIQDCGTLVPDGHDYTIRKSPNSFEILIENEPAPIRLVKRPDGGLTGPGSVDVKGRVITGYYVATQQLYVGGQPAFGPEYGCLAGPCTTTTSTPQYAPKIERCTLASFVPPASRAASTFGSTGSVIDTLANMVNTVAPASEPGLRMSGRYGSPGGLRLDFDGAGVVLDCGQAHSRVGYTVDGAAPSFVVNVLNGGATFTLAVEPDSTLHGTGSTTVNGRLYSGVRGTEVKFTSHSERCDIGAFTPETGSAVAPPAPSAPVQNASSASRALLPVSSDTSPVRISVQSTFPAGANPVAGQPVFIMHERMDDVLRKLGVPVAPNTTPGKAMQALAKHCRTVDCRSVIVGLGNHYVSHTTFVITGKADLSADVAGSYFVFAMVRMPNGSLIWDLPVTLSAGDNSVTLTVTNAELIH